MENNVENYLDNLEDWELLELFKKELLSRVDPHAFIYREHSQFSDDMKIAACLSILNMGFAV